jgi:hypothetical protein
MIAPNTINLQIGGVLELILRPAAEEGYVSVTAVYDRFKVEGKGNQMYTLPVDKLIKVQVSYVDAHGNPAAVDGDVTWASSNPEVAHIDVDQGDSTICTVSAIGEVGTSQITATADADLGAGVRELVTLLDVTVVAGEAVAGTINVVGEAQPIAPHAEPQRR